MPARILVLARRAPAVRPRWWTLVCCALLSAGCAGWQMPRIDPTGEHLFVPAGALPPPPGAPPPPPLAPVPMSVTISPSRVVAPIGSEVVLIASVGTEGYLLTHQRVEWTLAPEGVGQIVSPGVRRPFAILELIRGLPKKVDARYAINSTLFYPMTLDRGTPTPLDDIAIASGQSWISVTSPTEGTSSVTAFAPSVDAWDRRQQTASIYWIDAQWRFPSPAISPVGGRSALVTTVSRQSDNAPLAGWQVRYEIAGGSEAGFAPDGATSIDVITSPTGEATAEIFQRQPVPGANQVNIQVIRPPGAGGQVEPIVVGSGGTLQTWADANVAVPGAALPSTDAGAAPTYAPPPTTTPPTSTPPTFTPPAETAPPAQAPTPAATAELDVTINGPSEAVVGGHVEFQIQVVNRGAAPARRLLVTDRFDDGLKHAISSSPIERDLVDLQPGGMQRLNVNFEVVASGQLCQDVEVTGEGGLRVTARACLAAAPRAIEPPRSPAPLGPSGGAEPTPAEPPGEIDPLDRAMDVPPTGDLTVRATAPERRAVGESAVVTIEVTNGGQTPVEELVVGDAFDASLEPLRATEGNEWLPGNALGWKIASLGPGRSARREIEFKCLRETPRACNRITVSGRGASPAKDEACIEIVVEQAEEAAPAAVPETSPLKVSIADTVDPVKVNGETTYHVQVENLGTQSQFNVALSIDFGEDVRLVGVTGPVQGEIRGGTIRFAAIKELRAGETPLSFELRAQALRAGTIRLRAELTSQGHTVPVTTEHTTEVLQ